MQAVLYHHGFPQQRNLLTLEKREWLGALKLPAAAITVYQCDQHRAPGHLSRQGPPALRWALYEAAQRARFPTSPDRQYYLQTAERIGGNRACIALARKLLKRSYHLLRELGDHALEPVAS
jgi:transposase